MITRLRQLSPKSKVFLSLGIAFALSLVSFIAFLFHSYSQITVASPYANPVGNALPQDPSITPVPDHTRDILLLGYGGVDHDGGKLTDSMILMHIDEAQDKIFLISVPRDLWVSLPLQGDQETYWKINAAYAIGSDDRTYPYKPPRFQKEAGGGELAKYAVSLVTGISVDNFIAIDFNGFTKAIDKLGSIDVKVDKTFDDYWYPVKGKENDTCGLSEEEVAATATMSADIAQKLFPCRFEHLHFEQGIIRMDGTTALKFARSRHSDQDGSDFGRSARQKNVIIAVKERIFALNFLPKVIPLIQDLSANIRTDLNFDLIQQYLSNAQNYRDYQITTIELSLDNVLANAKSQSGQYILIPKTGQTDWALIHDYLKYQLEATTAATPTP